MCPSSSQYDPENGVAVRRLLIAIVRRAVLDFVLYRDVTRAQNLLHYKLHSDAARWLFFDGTEVTGEDRRYTFLHICLLTGLDPRRVRDQALVLTRDDLKRFNNNNVDPQPT